MSRYAVLAIGSHQYQVEENAVVEVQRLPSLDNEETKEVTLDKILILNDGGKVTFGQPFIPKASVTCEILEEIRLPKVISFKFKRRKGYRRKKGHRQSMVRLRVKSIQG